MRHEIRFKPGYDCIRFECLWDKPSCMPDSDGSHGRHGLNISFFVSDDEGAIEFDIYSGWIPQKKEPDGYGYINIYEWSTHGPMAANISYHSKVPRYEGEEALTYDCEFTGGPCFCNGSGLNANDAMYTLVNGGDKELWGFLEQYYRHVFFGEKYPDVYEYPKSTRAK